MLKKVTVVANVARKIVSNMLQQIINGARARAG